MPFPRTTRPIVRAAVAVAAATAVGCSAAPDGATDRPSTTASAASATGAPQEVPLMRIQLTVGTATAAATLYDNPTARDFAALLPLTVTLRDLGGREKVAPLPRELTDGRGQDGYRAGQLGYWAPSADLAIYYLDDGFRVPAPGIVLIGEIESGLAAVTGAADGSTLTVTAAS
ncbi:cyclophilin-like fold protein [Nocardia harenae]|uniref:cyclophilin-like fold protein n=1 Tax=Nocardia harenae TaxID=358707 RepID=UPI00082C7CF8|nr:cyclophilin-like fold protein [Nocardia harenae]